MTAMSATREIATIMLPEKVDSVTAQTVEKAMIEALHPGARVIVDGSAVNYMSAAGVRAFATALRAAEARRAQVVFCRFGGAAADCLVVAGFSKLLEVTDSVEAAEAQLRRGPVANPAERLHKQGVIGSL